MSDQLEQIFNEYTRLRLNGLQATEAVTALRPHINTLREADRNELARNLRAWEGQRTDSITNIDRERLRVAADAHANQAAVQCPECSKDNDKKAVVCTYCGALIDFDRRAVSTAVLEAGTGELDNAVFDQDSTLVLYALDDPAKVLRLQPQLGTSQLTLGRSHTAPTHNPDVDLDPFGADEKGVSRIHAAIAYDEHAQALYMLDMGSTNGTFVNGRRLQPNERRSLRSGDSLRLGRLRLTISYECE